MGEHSTKQHHKSILVLLFIIIGVLLVTSIVSIGFVTKRINASNTNIFSDRAETASLAINHSDLIQLTGTASDVSKPAYQTIKQTLKKVRDLNADTRFVYLMNVNQQNKLVFLVDSEDENSPDYSAPGDIYNETEQFEIDNYRAGGTIVTPPQTDRWGTWYSAETSITQDGKTIAMLGMDISAENWQNEIIFIRTSLTIVAVLLFSFLVILYVLLRQSVATVENLSDANTVLFNEREHLEEIGDIAHVGYFKEIPTKHTITWDEQSSKILGLEEQAKQSIELFESLVFHEDIDMVRQKIDDAIRFERPEISFKFRIVRNDGMVRTILAFCKIHRAQEGGPSTIAGTFQDITNI
ncbi:MAG: PAS domain-containing protein [bacterium]